MPVPASMNSLPAMTSDAASMPNSLIAFRAASVMMPLVRTAPTWMLSGFCTGTVRLPMVRFAVVRLSVMFTITLCPARLMIVTESAGWTKVVNMVPSGRRTIEVLLPGVPSSSTVKVPSTCPERSIVIATNPSIRMKNSVNAVLGPALGTPRQLGPNRQFSHIPVASSHRNLSAEDVLFVPFRERTEMI